MSPFENAEHLIEELRRLPSETEYVEFKTNNANPEQIGRDISALANSAARLERRFAYKVWGIDDASHDVVGTTFDPRLVRKGSQELELWLRLKLSDNAQFEFEYVHIDGMSLVLLRIWPAIQNLVLFDGKAYIRSGSSSHELVRGSQRELELWAKIQHTTYESQIAASDIALDDVTDLLGFEAYFERQGLPTIRDVEGVVHYLVQENLAFVQDNGLISITNMGALLFAKNFSEFPTVARKAARVIQYGGDGRLVMSRQRTFPQGYVLCLDDIVGHVLDLLPATTVIERATRHEVTQLPEIAIREAVANALIHQDFGITGAGPLVEVFSNRVEITNPGVPLVDTMRILNDPPRSRNEQMAALLRRLDLCEEAGSGWDKMVAACELRQLPAPRIETAGNNTRVVLFADIPFKNLTPDERRMGCYWHACVKYANADAATNKSLRERFGLSDSQSAQVSRLVRECMEQGLIKQLDPAASKKNMRYVPWWA